MTKIEIADMIMLEVTRLNEIVNEHGNLDSHYVDLIEEIANTTAEQFIIRKKND